MKKALLTGLVIIVGTTWIADVSESTRHKAVESVSPPAVYTPITSTIPAVSPQTITPQQQGVTPVAPTDTVRSKATYSEEHYYTNVDGKKVKSPVHTESAPAGATARCRDGTYSSSQHRSGTCSHHGGVATWL